MEYGGSEWCPDGCLLGRVEDYHLASVLDEAQIEQLIGFSVQHGFHTLYASLSAYTMLPRDMTHAGYPRYLKLCRQFPKVDPNLFDGLEIYPLCETGMKNYGRMVELFDEGDPLCDVRSRNQNAYKAFLLFETPEKFQKFVTKICKSKWKTPYLTAVNQIAMPPRNLWQQVNFRDWGNAFLRFGLESVNPLFSTASPYLSPVRKDKGISLRDTWAQLFKEPAFFVLPEDQSEQLIDEIQKWNVNANVVKRILSIMAKEPFDPDITMQVPSFEIDGEKFGMDGTLLRKMDDDDMRMFFMGRYTGCCEWVGGEYAGYNETPEHVYVDRTSNYYLIEDYDGGLVGYSWVWRSLKGDLVFDGVEVSREYFMTAENIRLLMNEVVKELSDEAYKDYEVKNVFIGKCAYSITDMEETFLGAYKADALELLGRDIGANTNRNKSGIYYVGTPRYVSDMKSKTPKPSFK